MGVAIEIQSGDPAFDALPGAVSQWLEASSVSLALGEDQARGYRAATTPGVALREHTQAIEAAVYFDADLSSALDIWLRAPLPDGSLFNSFAPLAPVTPIAPVAPPNTAVASTSLSSAVAAASPAATFSTPSTALNCGWYFDDAIRSLRLRRDALEADSESRAVQAVHRAWQASGDTAAMQARLPVLERALSHLWKHPARWSHELDLPKRDFTLDSWPVAFGSPSNGSAHMSTHAGGARQFPQWCVHPGDAAHLFAACRDLGAMHEAAGNTNLVDKWRERAAHIEAQINSVGWNGAFYSHQIHVTPVRVRGVDEARQLGACNLVAINAGVASQEQCASILREYTRRRELNLETSFCEWWSVQPPFPAAAFDIEPGVGPNGGCWPQIGGELALAALRHGFENYGVETLRRYYDLAVKPRRTFPWYAPDGTPPRAAFNPNVSSDDFSISAFAASETQGTDANGHLGAAHEYSWDGRNAPSHDPAGAASMLRALIEGVCGVRDLGVAFSRLELAPRWPATGQASARVEVSYAANPAYVSYRWALEGGRMTLDYECKAKHVDLHILLPRGNTPERVALNGRTHEYALVTIEKSKYVDITTERKRGTVAITLK